jgi:hypothetical protein
MPVLLVFLSPAPAFVGVLHQQNETLRNVNDPKLVVDINTQKYNYSTLPP